MSAYFVFTVNLAFSKLIPIGAYAWISDFSFGELTGLIP